MGKRLPRGRRWRVLAKSKKLEARHRCSKCGMPGILEAHHVIPVHQDSRLTFEPDNIKVLCQSCHAAAHGRFEPGPMALAWRELVEEIRR